METGLGKGIDKGLWMWQGLWKGFVKRLWKGLGMWRGKGRKGFEEGL